MSLDLSLLVFVADGADRGSLCIANTMLEVLPDEPFAEALFKLERDHGRPVPDRFMTYTSRDNGEVRYGNTQSTPYGEALLWVRAKKLADHMASLPDVFPVNRAARIYLAALPTGYGVALYWH